MSNLGGSKSFIRLLKETSFAYFFGLGGIFAGFMVASYLGIFDLAPWTIALYPVLISAKGVTGGLLSGRLSTALHLGTVRPNFFNNTQGMLFNPKGLSEFKKLSVNQEDLTFHNIASKVTNGSFVVLGINGMDDDKNINFAH